MIDPGKHDTVDIGIVSHCCTIYMLPLIIRMQSIAASFHLRITGANHVRIVIIVIKKFRRQSRQYSLSILMLHIENDLPELGFVATH